MSGAVVPDPVLTLLTTAKIAVVATVRPDGQPVTAHDFEREIFSVELEHVRSSAG